VLLYQNTEPEDLNFIASVHPPQSVVISQYAWYAQPQLGSIQYIQFMLSGMAFLIVRQLDHGMLELLQIFDTHAFQTAT
jgi:hypothetical protein